MILAMAFNRLLAWIPIWTIIAVVSSSLYYFIFWFLPMDGDNYKFDNRSNWKKWKWVIINHIWGILLAWAILGVIYLCNHPEM